MNNNIQNTKEIGVDEATERQAWAGYHKTLRDFTNNFATDRWFMQWPSENSWVTNYFTGVRNEPYFSWELDAKFAGKSVIYKPFRIAKMFYDASIMERVFDDTWRYLGARIRQSPDSEQALVYLDDFCRKVSKGDLCEPTKEGLDYFGRACEKINDFRKEDLQWADRVHFSFAIGGEHKYFHLLKWDLPETISRMRERLTKPGYDLFKEYTYCPNLGKNRREDIRVALEPIPEKNVWKILLGIKEKI